MEFATPTERRLNDVDSLWLRHHLGRREEFRPPRHRDRDRRALLRDRRKPPPAGSPMGCAMSFGSRFHGPRKAAKGNTTRRVAGVMNKTEARYEVEILVPGARDGSILWWAFEGITVKLGPNLRYEPDFIVQRADGVVEIHDVKAGDKMGKPLIEDAGRVKMISAAEKFPFPVRVCWFDKTVGAWVSKVY